jgi:FAD/FMN-containing dehydrogenase
MKIIENKKILGWSKSDFSISSYALADSVEKLQEIFSLARKQSKSVSLRGAGRSYGDNTLNNNNIVLKFIQKKKIIKFNEVTGQIEVTGCCKIIDLLHYSVPKGWLPYVSPASQFVTIAGAISNNVHGKNCYQMGYFGDYVEEIVFYSTSKGIVKCSPIENEKFFNNIIGGLGLLGVVISVKIKLRKIRSIKMETTSYIVTNLENAAAQMTMLRNQKEFNIGSLNFTRFKSKYLGKIYSSSFCSEGRELEVKNFSPNSIIKLINIILLINKLPRFNKYIEFIFAMLTTLKSFKKQIFQNYFQMNFLGDIYLPLYNHFFKRGFIEYQVIFSQNNFLQAVEKIKIQMKKNNYSSFMSSFKSYKACSQNYSLGIKQDGFCITLDIPFENNEKFYNFIRIINKITIEYNGVVYLGKNPCLNSFEFKSMYPKYNEFLKVKNILDPENILCSDMSKRIFFK